MNNRHTISRRKFITGAAAAVAAPMIIPATAIGRGGRPAPSERINMAAIGFGTIALQTNRSFLQDERVQLVAVADPSNEPDHYGYKGELKAGRDVGKNIIEEHYTKNSKDGSYKGCSTYEDFRELLEKEDVDAVNISTPDHWHALMAITAARKGKHIYCQKPLGLTIEEGRKMVEEVTKAGVTWQTGSQKRSEIYFRQTVEYVRNNRIGEIQHIKVGLPGRHPNMNRRGDQKDPAPIPEHLNFDLWQGPAPERPYCPALLPLNWRNNFSYSGGMLSDLGAHFIDIAQWALDMDNSGPVLYDKIEGVVPPETDLYNTATSYRLECTYPNGIKMTIADKPTSQIPLGVKFEGEDGKWIYATRGKIETNPKDLRRNKIRDDEIHVYRSPEHHRNFINCIYSGEPTAAPIEAAHRTASVCHIANIGLRLGVSTLKWDPQKEQFTNNEEANKMLGRPMRAPWTLG